LRHHARTPTAAPEAKIRMHLNGCGRFTPVASEGVRLLPESQTVNRDAIMSLPLPVEFMMVVTGFLLVSSLCRRYKIPRRVGLILAGLIAGRSGLDIWPDAPVIMSRFAGVWMPGILRHT
jgi:hypothetical protein